MFFDFQGQKVLLKAVFEALRASSRKRGVFSGFARSPRAVWVLMGPTRTPNDKIMTVLVNICPFYDSPWKYFIFSCDFCLIAPKFLVLYRGDIVTTYILTDARNALLFLAFTHMSYSMPSGENKENKAYSRWIFFNLWPNEIARIIENLQKGMFVPTRGANVYKEHTLSNILQKEVPMGSETWLKNSDEWCSLTFRAKKSCLRLNLRVLRAPGESGEYFLESRARRKQFEYLWVRHGLWRTKLWPF